MLNKLKEPIYTTVYTNQTRSCSDLCFASPSIAFSVEISRLKDAGSDIVLPEPRLNLGPGQTFPSTGVLAGVALFLLHEPRGNSDKTRPYIGQVKSRMKALDE